jgi:hypothetical protein
MGPELMTVAAKSVDRSRREVPPPAAATPLLTRVRNVLPDTATVPDVPVMVMVALSLRPDASRGPDTVKSTMLPTDLPVFAFCQALISSLVYSRTQDP